MPNSSRHTDVLRNMHGILAMRDALAASASRPLRLSIAERNAMSHLMSDDLTMGELSARLGLSPSTVTNVVDRLERRGLAVRQQGTTDRRTCQVAVTDAGRLEFADCSAGFVAVVKEALDACSDAEGDVIVRFFDDVARRLGCRPGS